MQLLSLTLDGFKSFADKTVIKFHHGVTGIVGPNGSGKSNIIEAIRWVMGEQSAKSLRGDKMADVIFNGSTDRKPLNRALVSITFDNSDHYLKSDFSTVTVTRKLYRNGDSEYAINGNDVRLRDIVDLFIDSGIGRDSFSIINQGQIQGIFSGKAKDRREIIEAVAGVTKYKQNKKTAGTRLDETNANLNRVHDLTSEIKEQLEPLASQSALAQDYLEQKDEFDLLDRTAIVRNVLKNQAKLSQVCQSVDQAQKLVNDYESQLAQKSKHLNTIKDQQAKQNTAKDQLAGSVLQITEQLAHLRSQKSLATVKRSQTKTEQQRLEAQATDLKGQQHQNQQELTKLQAQLTDESEQIKTHQAKLTKVKQLTGKALAQNLAQQLDRLRNQQIDLLQQQTSLHNQLIYLKRNHERSAAEEQQSAAALKKAQDDYEAVNQESQQQATSGQKLAKQLQALGDQLSQENEHQQKLASDYQRRQRDWYEALSDVHSASARLKSYQTMAADYTGYYQGVQHVLQHRDQFSGLCGPVNELIEVPPKLTTALDTVLGGQLQQLVVDTQQTGRQIIDYLVQNRGGRVTLLPLDTLRSRRSPLIIDSLAKMPGFIGAAADLIHYDPQYRVVVSHLLANTVIVDNLKNATRIARAGHHQVRLVTLDGQLINASGAMTGGAQRHQRAGLLAQQQMAKDLQAECAKQQSAAQQIESEVAKLNHAKDDSQQLVSQLRQRHSQLSAKVEATRTTYRVTQTRLKELKRRVNALQYEADQASDSHHDYESQAQKLEQSQTAVTTKLKSVAVRIQSVTDHQQHAASDADAQAQQRHAIEQWLATHFERREALIRQQKSLLTNQKQLANELKTNQKQLRALQSNLASAQSTQILQDIKDATEKLTAVKRSQSTNNDQLAKLNDDRDAAETDLTRLQELREAAKNNENEATAEQMRLSTNLDHSLNRLSERYSMSLKEAQQHVSDLPEKQLASRLKLLRRGIAELGEVNVGAIDEYQRLKKRYDFLTKQQNDLITAREQLRTTMREMDGQVKERFKATFDAVNAAFAATFTDIFEGGRAKLKLTDPHDLLTTGVDIMAQPPGKRTTQMSLLSGGEQALTAITLLFAIIKVRPVPFAILDEPEAALDDLNVQRFAKYLGQLGRGTHSPQFIVITHRKGTMENADVLYGVTMQESGVSRMVSVNVVDALAADSDAQE